MMYPLISVIVPVYNVQSYLSRCLESIISQSYNNLEIILVDDGSTDSSGEIIDSYALKDNRIVVIHKENGGLSSARNAGLDIRRGDFVTFIDSDDYVANNYVMNLYLALISVQADLAICGIQIINENNDKELSYYSFDLNKAEVLTQTEAVKEGLRVSLRQSAWGKLYRSMIFDDLRFPDGLLYEDLAIFFRVLLLSNRIIVSDCKDYYYLIRQGSIMQSKFDEKQLIEFDIINTEMDNLLLNYPNYNRLIIARRVYSYLIVVQRIFTSNNVQEYMPLLESIRNYIMHNIDEIIIERRNRLSLKLKVLIYALGDKAYVKSFEIFDSIKNAYTN